MGKQQNKNTDTQKRKETVWQEHHNSFRQLHVLWARDNTMHISAPRVTSSLYVHVAALKYL